MTKPRHRNVKWYSVLVLAGVLCNPAAGDDGRWIELSAGGLSAWKEPTGRWQIVAGVGLDPGNPKRFNVQPGTGVIVNGPTGKTNNLVSKRVFRDIELHMEFVIPQGSNSGVKFHGQYEIQIVDSWQVKTPGGSHCGGIYPRAEQEPRYHHIDKGIAPTSNAALPPGKWQTLDVVFQSPRFDEAGNKIANARFVRVVLNGKTIHKNVQVPTPTGHAWQDKEHPAGPLFLQADHGPVAFRNVRVRQWDGSVGSGE